MTLVAIVSVEHDKGGASSRPISTGYAVRPWRIWRNRPADGST